MLPLFRCSLPWCPPTRLGFVLCKPVQARRWLFVCLSGHGHGTRGQRHVAGQVHWLCTFADSFPDSIFPSLKDVKMTIHRPHGLIWFAHPASCQQWTTSPTPCWRKRSPTGDWRGNSWLWGTDSVPLWCCGAACKSKNVDVEEDDCAAVILYHCCSECQ